MTFTSPHPFTIIGGQDIGLLPSLSELTVAQATQLIDTPEGYIDELLDADRVAFRWENNKRLVKRDSLLNCESAIRHNSFNFALSGQTALSHSSIAIPSSIGLAVPSAKAAMTVPGCLDEGRGPGMEELGA